MKIENLRQIIAQASDKTAMSYTGRAVNYPSLKNLQAFSEKERVISSHLEEIVDILFKAYDALEDMDPLFGSTEKLKQAFERLEQK